MEQDRQGAANELPRAFLDRMQAMLGKEYEAFLAGFERETYRALRVNPLKWADQNPPKWTDSRGSGQEGQPFHLTPVSWEGHGYYYDPSDQPGRHPYHEAGAYYIQEPSAQAAVPLMEVCPGDKVLDLCAAPGGKSTQIAAALQGKGLLVSNEVHPARAKVLSENLERMGVRNACVLNENVTRLSEKFPEYFDRILVDAPCSGEGMFRKSETARAEWSPENVELCAARQDEILDHAAAMLRPGGRLVYSTCTFAPRENEGSVSRFLKRHPDFVLLPIDKERMGLEPGTCDGRPEWAQFPDTEDREGPSARAADMGTPLDGETQKDNRMYTAGAGAPPHAQDAGDENLRHTLRLWPHLVKGEGHFAAVFQKAGNVPEGWEAMAAGGLEPGISPDSRELDSWWEFAKSVLGVTSRRLETKLLRFGDNLYEVPACLPSLKGLKVLRPGLHVGTLKKNRFEPGHALALALPGGGIRHICHLTAGDERVSAYLSGQTFSYSGPAKPAGSSGPVDSANPAGSFDPADFSGSADPAGYANPAGSFGSANFSGSASSPDPAGSMEEGKGWYLICVDGFSLGWGKLAGGVMKNHYPKGLRKNVPSPKAAAEGS